MSASATVVDEHYINRLLARAAWRMRKYFPDDIISVTEVTHPCLRYSYLSRRASPQPTGYEALLHLGNALHEKLEFELALDGWQTEVRLALNVDGIKIVGRADAIKERVNEAAEVVAEEVMEIKSVDRLPDRPHEHHVKQLQTYLAILDAPIGYLVYIDRGSGRNKVFRVRRDPRILEQIKKRAKQLHRYLTNNELPPAKRGPWCRYCPYQYLCWARR